MWSPGSGLTHFDGGADAFAATAKFIPTASGLRVPVPALIWLAEEYRAGGMHLVDASWASGAFEERLLALKLLECVAHRDARGALEFVAGYWGRPLRAVE